MSGFEENLEVRETKTLEETDKKCPSCGGVMEFDPTTVGLACPYCGHTEEIRKEKHSLQRHRSLILTRQSRRYASKFLTRHSRHLISGTTKLPYRPI